MSGERFDIQHFTYRVDERRGTYDNIKITAGNLGIERIVPPAGDEYAFGVQRWKRTIEVSVSPTGRSVQVYVDGNLIPPTPSDDQGVDSNG